MVSNNMSFLNKREKFDLGEENNIDDKYLSP